MSVPVPAPFTRVMMIALGPDADGAAQVTVPVGTILLADEVAAETVTGCPNVDVVGLSVTVSPSEPGCSHCCLCKPEHCC
jgi:hypothetical protein